ncbi:hypothetical protein Q5H93_05545 [Hymenobacter sp. ASUV-10]|uniref:DUF1735 domain-containing protein n=1 Tax=Hymenobacter aranciens TaxID=3063996 RepID=A0ABT9B7D4_9BACT|nr:hypothetical protein [Hymenobacter sp. ASUV-10]MDO7874189.1 hypothetical protein [Hymenobacter sp. ASUV-10]
MLHRLAWLLLLALPLLSLKCDDDDVIKPPQFEVTIRVTGTDLYGLGAELTVTSTRNILNPSAGPALTESFPTSISQTYPLGTFGLQDRVEASVAFRNVTCNSTLRPASNSKLLVEVLANGLVVGRAELTPTSSGSSFVCSPYWLSTTVGEGDDWD